MMTFEPFFPITADPTWLLSTFAVALLLFDLILVRWLRLGRKAWKRVDYMWLAVSAVGLLGTATDVRRMMASSQMGYANGYKASAYGLLLDEVGTLGSIAVCRPFTRSEWSPSNLDEIQREYDSVCDFGRQLRSGLPSEPPEKLDTAPFVKRPSVTDRMLKQIYSELDSEVGRYESVETAIAKTTAAAGRSSGELTLSILSPLLLAIALALRITKVTGELKSEA